jgi:hypothetical protein
MNIPHYYHHFSPIKLNKYLKSGVILNKRVNNILKELVSDGNSLYTVYEAANQFINGKIDESELAIVFNGYRATRGSVINNSED